MPINSDLGCSPLLYIFKLAAYKNKLYEKKLPDDVIEQRILHRRKKNTRVYKNKRLSRWSNQDSTDSTNPPIIWDAASKDEHEFELPPKEDSRQDAPVVKTTVARYFAEKHELPLDFKHMPAIFLRDGNQTGHFPIEFHFQAFGKVKGVDNNAHVLKWHDEIASTTRLEYVQMVNRHADMVMHNSGQDIATLLEQFHLTASNEPLTLTATVIKQPEVCFKAGSQHPRDGSWDLRNAAFVAPATMTSFAILDFTSCNLGAFELLFRVMQRHGIKMPRNTDLKNAISSLAVRVESRETGCVSIWCIFCFDSFTMHSYTHHPLSNT